MDANDRSSNKPSLDLESKVVRQRVMRGFTTTPIADNAPEDASSYKTENLNYNIDTMIDLLLAALGHSYGLTKEEFPSESKEKIEVYRKVRGLVREKVLDKDVLSVFIDLHLLSTTKDTKSVDIKNPHLTTPVLLALLEKINDHLRTLLPAAKNSL